MDLKELNERLKNIPAIWLSQDEIACLWKYAGLSQGPIADIGVAWGGSACILVLGSKQTVRSIDPFQPPLCNVDGYNINSDRVEDIVYAALGSGDNAIRWYLNVMTSVEAADKYKDKYYDFGLVFIDGNHEYDFVRQDVDLWLPLIQKHGYLILHDSCRDPKVTSDGYCQGWPGPTQVAQELSHDSRVKLIETVFSMTVWEVQ